MTKLAENRQFASVRRMISAMQIRMARAGLDWSQGDLANRVGVNIRTIRNIEKENVDGHMTTWRKIEAVLKEAGVEFLDSDGVRIQS